MLNRRQIVQGGAAAMGALVASPFHARAQGALVKVRYSEAVRTIVYTPSYVAIANGYFKDAGLDVALSTAQGGDKVIAALLSNSADIGLTGPEAAIYVQNSDSSTKTPVFCGLVGRDGSLLVGRNPAKPFDWGSLKGKKVMGMRPGSSPQLFLEAAMRQNGVDPVADIKPNNNLAIPARLGSWLSGDNDFAVFLEPEASQLELEGKAHILASVGATVGPAEYSAFMTRDNYLKNSPEVAQAWTNAIFRAQKWTLSQPAGEVAKAIAPFFQGIDLGIMTVAIQRYVSLNLWKPTPKIDPVAFDKFQDVLIQGKVLESAKRVSFETLIATQFADKAK